MATYRNPLQYGEQAFEWDPTAQVFSGGIQENAPGYLTELLGYRDRLRQGQTLPWEAEQYAAWEQAARAIPTRDIAALTSGWQGELAGQWGEGGWQEGNPDWWTSLDPGSPDAGPIMLGIRDRMDAGTATPQERALYEQTLALARDWNVRASVPQASDVGFGLGDNLTGALMTLALGATGGLAAAPLAAGGASLATTLGSLGTLSGIAGTGAGVLGHAMDQDWLRTLGLGLGAAGGVLGGVGGLASLWGTGVQNLSDAARLAQSAGRITGAVGRASGSDALRQASSYLGQAGQLGQLGSGILPTSVTDWSTQRGSPMEFDYSWDYGGEQPYDNWSWAGASPTFDESGGYDYSWDYGDANPAGAPYDAWSGGGGMGSLSLEDQVRQAIAARPDLYGDAATSGGGGWLSSVLGGLGQVGSFLGKNASWLGPAASTLGSLGAGALGASASADAAAAQAAALNRGIDLSTSQWLEQLARTAPWVQAGQQALGSLQGLAGQQLPGLPGATPAVSGAQYGLPSTTPGWTPQLYQGPAGVEPGAYRWTPQQGPSAANFRYTPGTIPQAAQYRYTPGAVPTLSGQELLANDPGVRFRLDEGRRALEASALARGTGMSGATLAALQRQGQELSSQEYSNAWNRASQQAQLREQWGQAASQMGWQQAEGEARLREQVNQIASQQGWTQAQAEATFREQQAQLASQQGWNQALQGQQTAFNQGLDTSKWNTLQQQQYAQEQYKNMLEQSKWRYGQDVSQNETDYSRQQALYKQQLAQHLLPWEQQSTLAQLGAQVTGQLGNQGIASSSGISNLLGQLGTAQGMGALGSAGQWNQAIAGGVGSLQNILRGLNA